MATITIPTGQALEALIALQHICGAEKMPASARYAFTRTLLRLQANPDLTAAETTRVAAIQRLGETKDGRSEVKPENFDKFLAEYSPVAATPVDLDIPLIQAAHLEFAPELSMREVQALDPFLRGE
jgi:hypothetical protein